MTLVMTVGEESLPCVSDGDDADSGCLATTPDDIIKHDYVNECYINKVEAISFPDVIKENEDDVESCQEYINSPFLINGMGCSDKSSEHQMSSEDVNKTKPLIIYESNITVNTITKFSPPKSSDINLPEDSNLPSINECKTPSPVQNSFPHSSFEAETLKENINNFESNQNKNDSRKIENNGVISSCINDFESPIVGNFVKKFDLTSNTSDPFQNTSILNNSMISNEARKIRLRKLMQRRSVSESSTRDCEVRCQIVREKLRHSFSSYDNCDKLHRILDTNFINNKDTFENETIKNNINKILNTDKNIESVTNLNIPVNNSSFEKVSRVSYVDIPDSLINNVKKSMIKEYQKLKKNSSMAFHNLDDLSGTRFDSANHKSVDCEVRYSKNINDAIDVNLDRKEIDDRITFGERNITPPREIRIRTISHQETCDCIPPGESENEFRRSHSFPLTISVADALEDNPIVIHESSPPSRLELWKSILAEKRNSIKTRVNEIHKNQECEYNLDNSTDRTTEIAVINDSSVNIHSDVNDNQITVIEYSNSPTIDHLEEKSYVSSHANLENNSDCLEIISSDLQTQPNSSEKTITCNSSDNGIPIFSEDFQEEKLSKRKSKLEEACEGIAYALDHIPEPQNDRIDMFSKNTKDSFINDVEKNCNMDEAKEYLPKCSEVAIVNSLDCPASNIASIITSIPPPPPKLAEIMNNEKGQQCPTPEYCSDDERVHKDGLENNHSSSSENESDYCQTDICGDDCDYCSGDEAEDEEEDTCEACRRNFSVSSVCKHTRVMTNGSLKSLRKQPIFDEIGSQKLSSSRSLALQAALRRRHINHQELAAIREYSITSDDQLDSDEDLSHDDSMCDLSSSWRYGLCEVQPSSSASSTLKNECKAKHIIEPRQLAKLKSNSLPSTSKLHSEADVQKRPESAVLKHTLDGEVDSCSFNAFSGGVHLPPRPPRLKKNRHPMLSISLPINPTSLPSPQAISPRPAMGLQGLQQRPSFHKHFYSLSIPTGPKTLVPRSPVNPNPPYGFPKPPSPPVGLTVGSPGSPFQGRKSLEVAPPSPKTNSRSGALVTRNFSISDDEGGQRLSRRQVTITRHESAYKEAADKGYLLPSSSPIDPYWLTWKLAVLLKTVEEVGSRLEESEKVVGTWGPLPQDQNLADQYVHNVRKFRETLPDLQRGVDDVNDQAARFSAHNVPLTPANSAALHDLNSRWKNLETTVNDRWRQIAGRSREVTPLTPAQLASSVSPPWERATATNKVPYYINHAQETTHWDHPQMMDLLDSLAEYNHIKFSAYRTATKLRCLQKKLSLDRAKLQMVTDVFDEHGLRGQNDRLIDVNDMIVVLSTLYGRISSDHGDVNTTLATDLCLNWLLNVYDSQRTGQMRVLSFRIGLICLCRGHLEEKYRYMFRLIADPNRLVDQRKLGLLLHDCVQVPRQLGEVAAFGGSNIEPSVRSCFSKAGKERETIEAVHFLTWVQQEPQSLVWLAVLHRVAASENVQHQVKCNICKTYPIVGLRYRCLKCLSFDMCQRCFFEGRSSKSHKITHPMHEYCTATTAGDEMKDFTKALKNKFKSKRSLQKHTKKGYLPVQTVLEGDPLESPSPSPSHNVSSQDMHSRLELYASRLAEVELRTNSNSTPDSIHLRYSEDEHGLIAQYCQSLSSTDAPFPVPKSPLQIMASVDADQKDELEQMIKDLEEENRALQAEYERLKSEQPTESVIEDGIGQRSEAEMLAEAKLLREHKGRLEARMAILEDHNRQLEAQLQRLRQLLVEQQSGMGSPNKSSTLQTKSVTASQLAMDSPAKINGHSNQGGSGSAYEGLDQMSEYVRPPPPPVGSIAHMGNLFSRAGDLEKQAGSPVAIMNREKANDSHSDDQSDENDYDNTVSPVKSKSE